MEMVLAYITTKDKDEARSLAQRLLESKIVACTNILSGMESSYWWEGKIETAEEAVLIAKLSAKHRERLVDFIQEHHSYSCPCVLFFKVDGGNPEYLNWLAESLG